MGLLAAVGTTMSALVGLAHGYIFWLTVADAAAASGLVVYATASLKKRSLCVHDVIRVCGGKSITWTFLWPLWRGMGRFAARVSGLASGLALAVRPAGSAEAPALKGGSRRSFLRSG